MRVVSRLVLSLAGLCCRDLVVLSCIKLLAGSCISCCSQGCVVGHLVHQVVGSIAHLTANSEWQLDCQLNTLQLFPQHASVVSSLPTQHGLGFRLRCGASHCQLLLLLPLLLGATLHQHHVPEQDLQSIQGRGLLDADVPSSQRTQSSQASLPLRRLVPRRNPHASWRRHAGIQDLASGSV